jgi:hypothetical protein
MLSGRAVAVWIETQAPRSLDLLGFFSKDLCNGGRVHDDYDLKIAVSRPETDDFALEAQFAS